MNGTLRFPRLPVVVLLLLCTLPSRVAAQQFVCRPIAAGDTASSLARRLTGRADAAYGLAFQIRDPTRQMFVPKSQYHVFDRTGRPASRRDRCRKLRSCPRRWSSWPHRRWAARWSPPVATTLQAIASTPLALARADRTATDVPFAATIAVVLSIVFLSAVAGSLTRRPIPPSVRRVGENFVAVFARPLLDASSGVPPIQTRLRFVRRKQQLEISSRPVAAIDIQTWPITRRTSNTTSIASSVSLGTMSSADPRVPPASGS